MNTNSTFQIGKDHTVCEDYALSGEIAGMAYIIVSDGCSASSDVDFGARCLAMSAKRTLRLHVMNDGIISPERFGHLSISNAEKVREVFPYLNSQFLDATLLVAWVRDGKMKAYLYGDGLLVHKTKDGCHVTHIHLTSGAPDYLSYHLDPLRRQAYENIEGNRKEITCESLTEQGMITTGTPLEPLTLTADVQAGDVIAVISDGINSFRKADNEPIDWRDLVDEFTGYKTTEGEFVLRRIAAFKRKCLKEGITHSDDISIASIVV